MRSPPLKILHLEDNPADAELVRESLARAESTYEWTSIDNERTFEDTLHNQDFHLILADYDLTDFNGIKALKIVRQLSLDIPFIFVSGAMGEDLAVECIKLGATDYVLKDKLERLPAVVSRALKEAEERRQRKKAETALLREKDVNSAIGGLASTLLQPHDIRDISNLVLEYAENLTDSEFGFTGYIHPETGALVIVSLTENVYGECKFLNKDPVFSRFTGLWGWVLNNRKPLLTNNPHDDQRSSGGVPEGHVAIERFIGVPALKDDNLLGIVALANPPHEYTDRHLSIACEIANLFAIAIDRALIQNRLLQEQYLLRTVIDNIPCMVYATDKSGRILVCNKTMSEIYGVDSPNDLTDNLKSDLHSGPEADKSREDLEKVIKHGECIINREEPGPDAAKTGRWISTTKLPLRNQEGETNGLLGIGLDITAHKNSEESLRKLNRELMVINECNGAIVHATDESSLLQSICNIIVEKGGYSMAWIGFAQSDPGKSVTPYVHAGDEQEYVRKINVSWADNEYGQCPVGTSIRTGRPAVVNDITTDPSFRPWTEEAVKRDFASVISLPIIRSGKTLGALTIYSNIKFAFHQEEIELLSNLGENVSFGISSLRTRAEQAQYREQLKEQAALLDLTQDAVIVSDLNSRVLFWNKAAEKIYGWTAGEILGKNFTKFFVHKLTSDFKDFVGELSKSESFENEISRITKTGETVIVQRRCSLIYDNKSNPVSILTIDSDITEKKQTQSQFLRAQRLESIGRLAGGIAHDLNNVLAPILMAVPLLRREIKNPSSESIVDTIESSTKRGAEIVRQILTFSRGTEGKKTALQLRYIIKEVSSFIHQTFPKNIRLETEFPKDLWMFMGDQTNIHQLLINLCVNAKDAMPDSGTLTIAVENVILDESSASKIPNTKPAPYVHLMISDTGIGIKQEYIEKIFDPFFTTKDTGKGTGLGLSTVMGIVKSHRGAIQASSSPNQGTQFNIYFPAIETKTVSTPEPEPPTLIEGHGELFLVADDEESVRTMSKSILNHAGFRTILAKNGTEALALYSNNYKEITAVLIDMVMPFMGGEEAIKTIRKIDPNVKIIVMSGRASGTLEEDIRLLDVNGFLQKPFTTNELLSVINSILEE